MKNLAVYISYRPYSGGAYQYWLAVLKAVAMLNKDRYHVICYSEYNEWKMVAERIGVEFEVARRPKSILQRGMSYFSTQYMPKWFNIRFAFLWNPFAAQLKKNNTEIWLSQSSYFAKNLKNVLSIVPIFDLMHRYHPELDEYKGIYNKLEKQFKEECKTASLILVDSVIGKQQVMDCYGGVEKKLENKLRVLPYIPPDYIYEGKQCEDLPYDIFDKYIFYPAQFWTHKNHVMLIYAVNELKKENIDVNLVFVGSEKNNLEKVRRTIEELKLNENIKILGYVSNEEMVYLYKHAKALVMPSLFGPTNIPQLEAFELGCPVAVSRIYGIPEQVGNAALLFDPENLKEITECIKALWTDDELCRKLSAEGKKRATQWGQKEFTELLCGYIEEFKDNENIIEFRGEI